MRESGAVRKGVLPSPPAATVGSQYRSGMGQEVRHVHRHGMYSALNSDSAMAFPVHGGVMS